MRALWVVVIGAVGGSCSKFEVACNRTFRELCDHQVACGIHFDSLLCQEEEAADSYCDPRATDEQFQACFTEFDGLQCGDAAGGACLDILCDMQLGCRETREPPCGVVVTEYGEEVPATCPE